MSKITKIWRKVLTCIFYLPILYGKVTKNKTKQKQTTTKNTTHLIMRIVTQIPNKPRAENLSTENQTCSTFIFKNNSEKIYVPLCPLMEVGFSNCIHSGEGDLKIEDSLPPGHT